MDAFQCALLFVAWVMACVFSVDLIVFAYDVDRQVGLLMVGFLSLFHVFLEFPVNWASIATIHCEVTAVWRNEWAKTENNCGYSTQLANSMPKSSVERVLVPSEK